MISDTDLPQQPDTPQQPPLMKKRNNPIWKVGFIILIVFNLIYLGNWLLHGYSDGMFSPIFDLVELLAFVGIIDLVAVLSYISAQHPHGGPHGIARVIIDAILIAAILALITAGIITYTIFTLVFQ